MRVSFDFDNTLSRPIVQKYAKKLVNDGLDVWIVTSRYDDDHIHEYKFPWASNTDLFNIAEQVGIPITKIVFTDMEDKWPVIKQLRPIWHLDDDSIELNMINANTKTFGISVEGTSKWIVKAERILKKYKNNS